MVTREYVLDTASNLGREQLSFIGTLFDPLTLKCLEDAGIAPGQRCLDVGAGNGTVARWMADRTGPTGTVVAVDLDTDQLVDQPGIDVRRHDINDGAPSGGPFDVIHARLVLMHLSRRAEILESLVDALAPGGWLVVADAAGPPQRVVSAPTAADEVLFYRVQHIGHHVVARGAGASYEWADETDRHMTRAGLAKVGTVAQEFTVRGGDTGCLLSRNYVQQMEPLLLDAGLKPGELSRYDELLLDPRFRAWFNRFVCTRGQRPL